MGASAGRREVRLSGRRPYSFGDYQLNYLNYRTRRLIPSTDVYFEGELYYRSNAIGCRGEEVDPRTPVVGLFGDSVIHGFQADWLARHVALPGCQSLNGGIEAMLLPWIVDRTLEVREAAPNLVCAAVHSGWHNITYNQRDEAFWTEHLDRLESIPVIAHFRLVADVNEDAVEAGYAAVLARCPNYAVWPGFDHEDRAERRRFADDIARFNAFIESYCRDRGRVLIDLEPTTAPRTAADLGRNFLDFIHPRPAAYPAMARAIAAQLVPAVTAALEARA